MSQRERAGGLAESWYAAALVSELGPRPLARVIFEQPLVLWRLPSGEPAALEDRCAHRNAMLSRGEVVGERIACPYHGWTYDAAGSRVDVPSAGPGATLPPCRVPRFPVCEQDGLVWVWMGFQPPGDRRPLRMPGWSTPGFGAYFMTTDFDNGVTQLVENFMDVPHTTFVHRGWFRSPAQRKVRLEVERSKEGVLVTYHQPRDAIGFWDRLLNPKGLPLHHTDRFTMPNHTRVDYDWGGERSFVITSTCTPVAPLRSRVYTLIAYRLGLATPLARWLLPWYTRRVIQQDVEIMANQGGNLRRFAAPRFQGTDADLQHEHVEALRQAACEGAAPPPPRRDEVEIWI